MRSVFCFLLLISATTLSAFEKLPEAFTITFGSEEAKETITEFFSFNCPKCIHHINHDFPQIDQELIQSKEVKWVFHPFPNSKVTLMGMRCLEQLSETEKRTFLQQYMAQVKEESQEDAIEVMEKVMEQLGKPIEDLDNREVLKASRASRVAVRFLSLDPPIKTIPSIEFRDEVMKAPNAQWIIAMVRN